MATNGTTPTLSDVLKANAECIKTLETNSKLPVPIADGLLSLAGIIPAIPLPSGGFPVPPGNGGGNGTTTARLRALQAQRAALARASQPFRPGVPARAPTVPMGDYRGGTTHLSGIPAIARTGLG